MVGRLREGQCPLRAGSFAIPDPFRGGGVGSHWLLHPHHNQGPGWNGARPFKTLFTTIQLCSKIFRRLGNQMKSAGL